MIYTDLGRHYFRISSFNNSKIKENELKFDFAEYSLLYLFWTICRLCRIFQRLAWCNIIYYWYIGSLVTTLKILYGTPHHLTSRRRIPLPRRRLAMTHHTLICLVRIQLFQSAQKAPAWHWYTPRVRAYRAFAHYFWWALQRYYYRIWIDWVRTPLVYLLYIKHASHAI